MSKSVLKFFGFINLIFIACLTSIGLIFQVTLSGFDIKFENLISLVALVCLNSTLAVLWFSKQNRQLLSKWIKEKDQE